MASSMIFLNLTKKVLKKQKYLTVILSYILRWFSLWCTWRKMIFIGLWLDILSPYIDDFLWLNTDCTNLLDWHSCPSVILAVYNYHVPTSLTEALLCINKVNVCCTRNLNTICSSAKEYLSSWLINCTLLPMPQSMQCILNKKKNQQKNPGSQRNMFSS